MPKTMPVSTATPNAMGMLLGASSAIPSLSAAAVGIVSTPRPMPSRPPMALMTTASSRNWATTSLRRAPTASRTPISRVRSVTVTSITFITPMPPTISETTAMAASSREKVRADSCCAPSTSLRVIRSKSSWYLPSGSRSTPWRSRRKSYTCAFASSMRPSSVTWATRVTEGSPSKRFAIAVLMGR